ncbi:MAG: (deoxy)nucleoside triphosphate pyrophosphohydrolase [Pedobacter sp.]
MNAQNESSALKTKSVLVVCGIIKDSEGNVLVTQRSATMALPFKWEFPGGKVEQGESHEEAIKREINEELHIKILIINRLPEFTHQYPTFTITLIPFVCNIVRGLIKLTEHHAFRWVNPNNLLDLEWAAADIPVAQHYLTKLNT